MTKHPASRHSEDHITSLNFGKQVIISWKWCTIEMWLLQVTNSEQYTTDLIAETAMTLSVLEAHFPTASLFRCDFSYQWHIL